MDVHMLKAWSNRLGRLLVLGCLVSVCRAQQAQFPTFAEPATFGASALFAPSLDDSDDADDSAVEHPLFADYQLDESGPTVPYHFTFTPRFLVGPVAGFIQAPKGNSTATSTHHRPRMSELGIHDAMIPDLELGVSRGPHEIYAGIQIIRFTGTQKIRQALETDGKTFAKGKRVRSDENLDWYRLGYRYSIPLFQGEDGVPRLMLVPQAELVWWTFEYRIVGNKGHNPTTGASLGITKAKKSYDYFTGRGGASLEWRPFGGAFSLEGKAMADPKVSGVPFIATEELLAKYRLLESNRYGMTLSAGVMFQQMDFNDAGKPRGNHIRADFGPLFELGANINF
jgi:hypothetical protein